MNHCRPFALVAALLFLVACTEAPAVDAAHAEVGDELVEPPVATFSIVAFDEATGDLGVAVESKFLAVGAVVPWAKAGVGAVATQAYANTTFGPNGLSLLAAGRSPKEAMKTLVDGDPGRTIRQVGIVDARGRAEIYSGGMSPPWAGGRTGKGYAVQGNTLASEKVVSAMADTFERTRGTLARRMLEALKAGQAAGGDKRGRQSAALLVVRAGAGYGGMNDRFIDLRVDDHKTPIAELERLLTLHERLYRPLHTNPPKRP